MSAACLALGVPTPAPSPRYVVSHYFADLDHTKWHSYVKLASDVHKWYTLNGNDRERLVGDVLRCAEVEMAFYRIKCGNVVGAFYDDEGLCAILIDRTLG